MPLLRVVSVALMAVWIGGLAVLGLIAAPSIFATLDTQDVVAGRRLAGLVFGNMFNAFQHAALGVGAALLAVLGLRTALGPRPRRLAIQIWLVVAMLAMSLVTTMALSPLHPLAAGLMTVTLLAGLGVFWIEVRE